MDVGAKLNEKLFGGDSRRAVCAVDRDIESVKSFFGGVLDVLKIKRYGIVSERKDGG